jgi:hypothetical protein
MLLVLVVVSGTCLNGPDLAAVPGQPAASEAAL